MSSDWSFQQHLEDVLRGVQVVLVVQTDQHLEDVVRGVQLAQVVRGVQLVQDLRGVQIAQVVRGVQVVLVVQIDQHLEDIVQGSEFPNGSQQPFNFSCKFLYFDQIFNLVVLFQE